MGRTKGVRTIDKIDQLIDRLNQNLSDYHDHIKGFAKEQIIEMAGRINAMSDAHTYMTQHHAFDYEQAEYLLQFKNPLEILADKWETRISDLSDMSFDLDKVFYDQDAEINGYELAEADAPAVTPAENAARESSDVKTEPPSLLDRRLTEHEFYKGMNKLLPDLSPHAMSSWISYANSLEYDGKQPAKQTFSEMITELVFVKQHYGAEIATQIFHVAFEMPINPSEIRGAANYLKDGVNLNEIIGLSLDGKLQRPTPLGQTADVQKEVERVVAAFKELTEPNSPNKTHFAVPLSREFMYLASSRDQDRLFDALPYKTTAITGLKGEKGLFVTVAKDELLKQSEKAQKPSVLGQLAEAAKEAAARPKAAEQSKKHDKEAR